MKSKTTLQEARLDKKTFDIERGKMKEFAKALGFENHSIFLNEAEAKRQGYKDIVPTPTFGIAIDLWGGYDFEYLCEKLKLNPHKVLHGNQEYKYQGTIYPGDTITIQGTISDVKEKQSSRGNIRFIVLENTYKNQNQETVLKAKITIAELC